MTAWNQNRSENQQTQKLKKTIKTRISQFGRQNEWNKRSKSKGCTRKGEEFDCSSDVRHPHVKAYQKIFVDSR